MTKTMAATAASAVACKSSNRLTLLDHLFESWKKWCRTCNVCKWFNNHNYVRLDSKIGRQFLISLVSVCVCVSLFFSLNYLNCHQLMGHSDINLLQFKHFLIYYMEIMSSKLEPGLEPYQNDNQLPFGYGSRVKVSFFVCCCCFHNINLTHTLSFHKLYSVSLCQSLCSHFRAKWLWNIVFRNVNIKDQRANWNFIIINICTNENEWDE